MLLLLNLPLSQSTYLILKLLKHLVLSVIKYRLANYYLLCFRSRRDQRYRANCPNPPYSDVFCSNRNQKEAQAQILLHIVTKSDNNSKRVESYFVNLDQKSIRMLILHIPSYIFSIDILYKKYNWIDRGSDIEPPCVQIHFSLK